MKRIISRLERIMCAVAFAEANEPELARTLLEDGPAADRRTCETVAGKTDDGLVAAKA